MKSTGKFVVCDRGNERSRMQIFTKHGHFVRKIAIRYIDIVAGLAITRDGNIVAVDSVTPTIFVIMEHGELLRWFDCAGETIMIYMDRDDRILSLTINRLHARAE